MVTEVVGKGKKWLKRVLMAVVGVEGGGKS